MSSARVHPTDVDVQLRTDDTDESTMITVEFMIIDLPELGGRGWMRQLADELGGHVASLGSGGVWRAGPNGVVSLSVPDESFDPATTVATLNEAVQRADARLRAHRRALRSWYDRQVALADAYLAAVDGLRFDGRAVVRELSVEPLRPHGPDTLELPEPVIRIVLDRALVRTGVPEDVLGWELPAGYLPSDGLVRIRPSTGPARIGEILADVAGRAELALGRERAESRRFAHRTSCVRAGLLAELAVTESARPLEEAPEVEELARP